MEDIEGDKAFDCKTLPIVYGIPTSKKIANGVALLLLFSILALLVVQAFSGDWVSFTYFLISIFIPICIVIYRTAKATKKRDFFLVSQLIKIIMLFGILYTGLIYTY
jgi:4-hydroxybenzoate polyprenyltransferase